MQTAAFFAKNPEDVDQSEQNPNTRNSDDKTRDHTSKYHRTQKTRVAVVVVANNADIHGVFANCLALLCEQGPLNNIQYKCANNKQDQSNPREALLVGRRINDAQARPAKNKANHNVHEYSDQAAFPACERPASALSLIS